MAQGGVSGRRGTLNRQLVLQAGLDLIDEHGLGAVTMRRVAERLHVEAMSLYTWVSNRDGMLDGIVELVVDQLHDDPEVRLDSTADWRDFLSQLAYGIRRTALRHPRAFPLVATRPPEAPWIRPPLRSLRLIEVFVSGLRGRGFDEDSTVYAYRAFTSFLLGYLLLETGALTLDVPIAGADQQAAASLPVDDQAPATMSPATADGASDSAGLDAGEYPTIAALSDRLADNRAEDEFRDALGDLLDRIQRQGSQVSATLDPSHRGS